VVLAVDASMESADVLTIASNLLEKGNQQGDRPINYLSVGIAHYDLRRQAQ